MSFRAAVVPEDPTYNGAILKPLFVRMLAECGRPNPRVEVVTSPRPQGYEHTRGLIEGQILPKYARHDLVLFCPDRDGRAGRDDELCALEERVRSASAAAAQPRAHFLCCAAVEEVETWLLAGHVRRLTRGWSAVRADTSVKEREFAAFIDTFGNPASADGGRETLMRETLSNYDGLKSRCPELADLESRIRAVIGVS